MKPINSNDLCNINSSKRAKLIIGYITEPPPPDIGFRQRSRPISFIFSAKSLKAENPYIVYIEARRRSKMAATFGITVIYLRKCFHLIL